ncbi:triggering receptor expressed on myeloid cells 3-like isoform X3 [Myotis daubentonii]|uniref:triggering receptor expressed on myeloid cells 3-like isoform X3 n=1 Tax=Myotis daubentonii TaxID=98922 RepID=UPI002872CA61|nr:triggering receptor expressed on myeloid cells 3-like isoform X3 [Myotis daubentonii]
MAWEAPYLLPLVLLLLLASVTNPRLGRDPGNPRYIIRDYPGERYFTVTMTALAEQDSGLYSCGFYDSSRINILRTIRLVVSQALTQASSVTAQVPPTSRGGQELSLPPGRALSELQVMAIVLTCGFVLNKGLVFSVLFVLLRKARASGEPNPGEQQSHPFRS